MSRAIFSPVPSGQYDILRVALEAAQLPTDDLEQGTTFFELADEKGVIGYIGLEGGGADRLLRSLVVLPTRRQQRWGGMLVAEAESVARLFGVERLHLLTTTAADFFRPLGYCRADRALAPETIRRTAQFGTLCPASAAYLTKELA